MTEVTLSTKLGALSMVDKLRHENMRVDENLNIEARRAQVKASLVEYYSHQGIECDSDLLDEGVRAYFDSRLKYEAPKLSWFDNLLAKVFIARDKWTPIVAIGLCFTVFSLGVLKGGLVINERLTVDELTENRRHSSSQLSYLYSLVDEVRDRALSYHGSALLINAGPLKPEMERYFTMVDVESLRLSKNRVRLSNTPIEYEQRAFLEKEDLELQRAAKTVYQDVMSLKNGLNEAVRILEDYSKFTDIMAHEDWDRRVKHHPTFAQSISNLEAVLQAVEYDGNAWQNQHGMKRAIANVTDKWRFLKQAHSLESQLAIAKERFSAMELSSIDQSKVSQLLTDAESGMKALDWQSVKSTLDALNELYDFSQQELEVRIVSRNGVKSGVRRTYEGNRNGHSYYLVAEAILPDGEAADVTITSTETQATKTVNRFAVKVDETVYESVKQDKLSDGIIENVHLGSKSKGQLSFLFDRSGVTNKFITEW